MSSCDCPPSTVLCFDRDRTISTNPPKNGTRAVPLNWVKYLAHEETDADGTRVDVWATGNQTLGAEAAIPGTKTAFYIWQHLIDRSDEGRAGLYDDPPALRSRKGTIRVIASLYRTVHPERDFSVVVVDDIDLSELSEHDIHHYHPTEFVEAVEDGTAPVSVPANVGGYTDERVADRMPQFKRVRDEGNRTLGRETDDPNAPLTPSFHGLPAVSPE